jgi:hypothetical protein
MEYFKIHLILDEFEENRENRFFSLWQRLFFGRFISFSKYSSLTASENESKSERDEFDLNEN